MTNHTPATPLPFVKFDEHSGQIVKDWTRGLPDQPSSNKLDLSEKREIVRRANAYPKLVEDEKQALATLRTVLHVIDREGTREQIAKHTPGMIVALRRELTKREALLRELGEGQ